MRKIEEEKKEGRKSGLHRAMTQEMKMGRKKNENTKVKEAASGRILKNFLLEKRKWSKENRFFQWPSAIGKGIVSSKAQGAGLWPAPC